MLVCLLIYLFIYYKNVLNLITDAPRESNGQVDNGNLREFATEIRKYMGKVK